MMRFLTQLKAVVPFLALCAQVSASTDSMMNSQIRLAYVGDTAMRVSWSTFNQVDFPVVLYGTDPYAMFNVAWSQESVTYNTSLVYANHVTLEGLEPDTLYYYLPLPLICNSDSQITPPFTFRTSRTPGDMTPYSVAVVIDLGTMGHNGLTTYAGQGVSPNNILQPGEQNTIQSLDAVKDDFDFIFHRTFSHLHTHDASQPLSLTSPSPAQPATLPMPTSGSMKNPTASSQTPPSKRATRCTSRSTTTSTTRWPTFLSSSPGWWASATTRPTAS